MKATQRAESGEAPWIEKRGPRYGNNRKMMADQKTKQRRILRAKDKLSTNKLITGNDQ